jgi:hypothetical protein
MKRFFPFTQEIVGATIYGNVCIIMHDAHVKPISTFVRIYSNKMEEQEHE